MPNPPPSPQPGKKIRTWILVADGARARILINQGVDKGLEAVGGEKHAATHAPTRDLGSERPGRTFDSVGGGRHAKEPRVDWHEFEKHQFAKKMAAVLDRAAGKDFDRLILVAPPKTLGDLRGALSKQTSGLISGELNKDLTMFALHELPEHLGKLIAL